MEIRLFSLQFVDELIEPVEVACRSHRRRPAEAFGVVDGNTTRPRHSFRNAMAGSMRAARQAGAAVASEAVTISTIPTDTNVTGSSGFTPYRMVASSRPRTAAS